MHFCPFKSECSSQKRHYWFNLQCPGLCFVLVKKTQETHHKILAITWKQYQTKINILCILVYI